MKWARPTVFHNEQGAVRRTAHADVKRSTTYKSDHSLSINLWMKNPVPYVIPFPRTQS